MIAARSFTLVNEYGQEYSLDNAEMTGLLTSPKGLGYDFTMSYIDIGDAFIRTKKKAKQSTIAGTLIFGSNEPYELYTRFSEFVRKSKELRLVYKVPRKTTAYYREVDLVKIEKTEAKEGTLQCAVEFHCKSLFYSNTKNNFTITEVEGELRYDITWPASYNDYSERTIRLSNTGDVDAPFSLTIEGYCENPIVILTKENEVIASIKFPLILQAGEKILYSCLDDDMYVYHQKTDGTKTNILQLLDINCDIFFKIPQGDYSVSFASDTGAAYTTALVMYKFYRTV